MTEFAYIGKDSSKKTSKLIRKPFPLLSLLLP